jgi:hypothetical protein
VNARPAPRLSEPRDLTALFRDALAVYFGSFGAFIALAAAVVVPFQLIVAGGGLEQLTAAYDPTPEPAAWVVPVLLNLLALTPLITAICIYALHSIVGGETAQPRRALVNGFEAFSRLFPAVGLAALGVAVGMLLILPGIYLFIRWFFVPQAVVVEGMRWTAALSRSWALTQGHWWRTFGIVVVANLAALVPELLVATPFTAIAESTDRALWSLIGTILTDTLTAPFLALFSTFLFYDLRARGSASPAA